MDKTTHLLRGLNLANMKGIEIGALDKPVVPPTTPGIFYVDYTDTETLRARYRNDPNVDVSNIVQVNGVWGQKTLAEIASPILPVDYVIASHVIEHVPDLITWLQEISGVLLPDGQVRLAVPDKRYTFDVLRGETDYADVLSAYLVRARVPQPRQVIDHVVNYVSVDCADLWAGRIDVEALVPHHPIAAGEIIGRDVIATGNYHDVHCWVFTPISFINLMKRLATAGYLPLKCVELSDTQPNTLEFFATLQRCDDKGEVIASWSQALAALAPPPSEEPDPSHDLEQRINHLHSALVDAEQKLQATVQEFHQSTSWRLTAPLRQIVTWLRG